MNSSSVIPLPMRGVLAPVLPTVSMPLWLKGLIGRGGTNGFTWER
jgi:hypothetical protein